MQTAFPNAHFQAHDRVYGPVSTASLWVAEQAADSSHGLTPGRSARQAEEVEKRNVPAGSNTTPELSNDATGAALVPCATNLFIGNAGCVMVCSIRQISQTVNTDLSVHKGDCK